jgi:hypothetical protein
MQVAVAADFMSRCRNSLDRARIPLRYPAQHKKRSFGLPVLQKFENLSEFIFNPGGKRRPSTLVHRRLDLRRMKVFLYIDGRGIEHVASRPYALRCLRKKTAMEYSIDTNPRTAVSARRSNIGPSRISVTHP